MRFERDDADPWMRLALNGTCFFFGLISGKVPPKSMD